jgi:hypothetical protein
MSLSISNNQPEFLQGNLVLALCAVAPKEKGGEPYVPVHVFSAASIAECRNSHGACTSRGKRGSWHHNFSQLGADLPKSFPLRFFYTKEGKLKNTGDKVQLFFNNKLLELTCEIQRCSYEESLFSWEYSYSYFERIQGDGWDYKEEFAPRLERKINKALDSNNQFFSYATLKATEAAGTALALAEEPYTF